VKEIHMQERSHSLGDIPRRTARRYPDKVAIIDGDLTLTFAEFDELVDRAAAALRDIGFTAGDRIALLARNCWQYAVLAFATARAAAIWPATRRPSSCTSSTRCRKTPAANCSNASYAPASAPIRTCSTDRTSLHRGAHRGG
jgi:acyl-CoA synthetase (AMP-forming)/AMP-acid ligase II